MNQISNNIVRSGRINTRDTINNIQYTKGKELFPHYNELKNVRMRSRADNKSEVDGVGSTVVTKYGGKHSEDIHYKRIGNNISIDRESQLKNTARHTQSNVNLTRELLRNINGSKDNKRVVELLHLADKAIEEEKIRRDKIINASYTGLERNVLAPALIKQQLDNNFKVINSNANNASSQFVSGGTSQKLLDVVKNKYGIDLQKVISLKTK